MTLYRALFYEPGHFHAALTLRMANARLAPDIHVYATPGPEREAFLTLVEGFNTRVDHPTHWRLHLHDGAHLLQRVVAEGYGNFVVLAGRNDTKLETMAYLTQAGLPVLADKPWLTESRQLPYLAQVTAGPCVAMDLMTGPYSIRAQVIAQVVHTPELFGTQVRNPLSISRPCTISTNGSMADRCNGRAGTTTPPSRAMGWSMSRRIWWRRRRRGCSGRRRAR